MAKATLSPLFVFGGLAAALMIFLSKKPAVPAKSVSTGLTLTANQQGDIALALQALGVDAGGKVPRRAPGDAIAKARTLAKTLSASGFPEAAATLNSYVSLAEKAGS